MIPCAQKQLTLEHMQKPVTSMAWFLINHPISSALQAFSWHQGSRLCFSILYGLVSFAVFCLALLSHLNAYLTILSLDLFLSSDKIELGELTWAIGFVATAWSSTVNVWSRCFYARTHYRTWLVSQFTYGNSWFKQIPLSVWLLHRMRND